MTRDSSSQVTTGLVMVVIGLVLLGGQLDLFDTWRIGRLWPLVMVAIGAAQWAATPPPGARRQGLGLMLAGSRPAAAHPERDAHLGLLAALHRGRLACRS